MRDLIIRFLLLQAVSHGQERVKHCMHIQSQFPVCSYMMVLQLVKKHLESGS